MTELARRGTTAAAVYEGVESVRDAADHRQRMAAAAELARRAGLDARDHLWAARSAERDLGRMILAARDAGDLTERGQNTRHVVADDMMTLTDLGVSRDMAAHAASLARLPDDVWDRWRTGDHEPSLAAVARSVREYEGRLARVSAEAEGRRAAERALRDQRDRIERDLAALAARVAPAVDVPPLTDDETDVSSVDFVAPATAVDEPSPRDARDHQRGDAWLTTLRELEQLVTALDRQPPELPHDRFADLTVLSARDLARRITSTAAVWLRTVNAAYEERIRQP